MIRNLGRLYSKWVKTSWIDSKGRDQHISIFKIMTTFIGTKCISLYFLCYIYGKHILKKTFGELSLSWEYISQCIFNAVQIYCVLPGLMINMILYLFRIIRLLFKIHLLCGVLNIIFVWFKISLGQKHAYLHLIKCI